MPTPVTTADAVCTRVMALLQGATDAGARVFEDLDDVYTREDSPCIVVQPVTDNADPFAGAGNRFAAIDQCELTFALVITARSATWRTDVGAVRAQAHALIMADATLATLFANQVGSASSLRRWRAEWQVRSADRPFGYCAQQYRGKYLAAASALSR